MAAASAPRENALATLQREALRRRRQMSDVAVETQRVQVAGEEAAPYRGRFGDIDSLRHRAARGTIINAVYQVGLAGLSVLRGLIAAALLTQSDYGVWGLLGLALWTAVGMKAIGVNDKYIQQSEKDQTLAFQRAFTIELIFAAILLPIVVAIVCVFAGVVGHPEIIAAGVVLTLCLPAAALQFPVWAFYRRMDFRRQRVLEGVDPAIATVATIVLAVAGLGYWALVLGAVLGAWGGAVLALRYSAYPFALRYDRGTLKKYVGFSAPLLISGIATLAVFQVVYLYGNAALGLAGLGAFTVAGNLVQFTDKADTVITETLYPGLCAVQDRMSVLFEAFVKSNKLALMWAMPFGFGLTLFAPSLVRFGLGERWSSAVGLIQVLGAMTAIHHVGFNWHAFFRARGRTGPVGVVAIGQAAGILISIVPLVTALGVVGLGWAFVAGEAVGFALRMRFLSTLFAGFRPLGHLVRALWPTAFGAAVVAAVRMAGFEQSTLLLALLQLGLFLASVAAATIVLERNLLKETIGYFGITTVPRLWFQPRTAAGRP